MADGEGLLAAQQSAAAQIPYRNSQMALQGAETAASSVVNAFFMAQQINSKRQQLENQLMNTQFKMTLDNQKFDNTIHEQAWKHGFEMNQEQRRNDALQNLVQYRDAEEGRKMDSVKRAWEQKDKFQNDANEVADKLTSAGADPATPYGSLAYDNILAKTLNENYTALSTPDGEKVIGRINSMVNAAKTRGHDAADKLLKNTQTTLKTGSRSQIPWYLDDMGLDPKYHIPAKDYQGNDTVTIAEMPVTNPTTNKQEWKPLSKDDLDKGAKPGRYRTINKKAYDSAMPNYKTISQIGSGDPSKLPGPVDKRQKAIDWLKENKLPLAEENIQHYINADQSQ